MNPNLQNLLDAIAEASRPEHIHRYLPNLRNESLGQCLLIYVTRPRFPEPGDDVSEYVSEYVTVETPVEIGLRMMGGLDPEEIIGIFPLNQPDEAICLARWAKDQVLGTSE